MQINHEENVRKTARYYKGHAKEFPVGALVWWNQTCTDKKDGDQIPTKKLKLSWSGPYIFQGVINDTMGKIEQQRNRQPTGKVKNVHLSQLRLYLRPEQYENELERPARRPGSLGSMGDSTETEETAAGRAAGPTARSEETGRHENAQVHRNQRREVFDADPWAPDEIGRSAFTRSPSPASRDGTISPIRRTEAWTRDVRHHLPAHALQGEEEMRSPPPSPGEGPSWRFDPPPPRRERNVARHATRDLVFPTMPYDRRFRKQKKTEGGPAQQFFREHGGQHDDQDNWSLAARTPLPPLEAGEGSDQEWMDQDAGVGSTRRPAHERAGDYRSARSFHIQPSEDQRREYHRRTHQHEQEDHRDRVVQQNRAKSARKGVAKSMGLISKKFKGLSKGNSSKGKAPPPPDLEWDPGYGWYPPQQIPESTAGGKSDHGGRKTGSKGKSQKTKSVSKMSIAKSLSKKSPSKKSRLPSHLSSMDFAPDDEQVNEISGNAKPPPALPQIWMIAPDGIQSGGRTAWWEAVSLVQSGRQPVPAHRLEGKLLIPRLNVDMLKKGLRAERLSLFREENQGPAILLSLNKINIHKHVLNRSLVQVKGPVRLGPAYAVERS